MREVKTTTGYTLAIITFFVRRKIRKEIRPIKQARR